MNPLLQETMHIPFKQIKAEHFLPAFTEAIRRGHDKIKQIKEEQKTSFHNTIVALEESGALLDNLSNIFFALHSAESNDTIRDLAKEISPLLAGYANDILLDQELFMKVKSVYEQADRKSLDEEDRKLLEETYSNFIRNGALLDGQKKQELRKIDEELAQKSLLFSDNVLKATNAYVLAIDDIKELAGLPETVLEAARLRAKEKKVSAEFAFTLDFPSYMPFMQNCDNEKRREELFLAYNTRSFKGPFDNRQIIVDITQLRTRRAQLLGFKNHADFTLQKRMASTSTKVKQFLKDLLIAAKGHALQEQKELQAFSKQEVIRPWNIFYVMEKLKKAKFQFDDEILRPYFKLENVIEGVFTVASKLYGLHFVEMKNVDVYHPEVRVFAVTDKSDGQNKDIGLLYTDFFPREGKRSGAWMTNLRSAKEKQRPHISIVCNFARPTTTRPSLLSFTEVTTLFHEFGHALHGLLADTRYASLSGTNVYWDFVELPSQIMENWAKEKECLDLFATHYETGENIPAALMQKMKEADTFMEGYQTMRQLSFGLLDMAYHDQDEEQKLLAQAEDVKEFESKAVKDAQVLASDERTCMSCSFSHIFSGGYAAGYYSYKWAEVLDADAFQYFQEQGIFNQQVALKFKNNILKKGGTVHPEQLYLSFRGKSPSLTPLLKRSGLIKS